MLRKRSRILKYCMSLETSPSWGMALALAHIGVVVVG
jgi:hypothetical protein